MLKGLNIYIFLVNFSLNIKTNKTYLYEWELQDTLSLDHVIFFHSDLRKLLEFGTLKAIHLELKNKMFQLSI